MKDSIQVITKVERRRYSDEERLRIVAETLESGVKIAEVCRRHGVARSLLQNWRKRLRCGTLPGVTLESVATSVIPMVATSRPEQAPEPGPFARVTIQPPPALPTPTPRSCARIVVGSGTILEIDSGVDPAWVARLLSAMGGQP